jgi:type II secretory pathway component PulJ
MKHISDKMHSRKAAFTLAETLAALTVGSMVLIIVLAFYNRAQTGAASVINKLENNRLPHEVLQRIAEDLDRIVGAGQGTQIDVANKLQDGFSAAKLEILRVFNDARDQPQPLEKIIWQSSIDPDSGLLTLYRSHSGIALEDKLLDEQKEPWQRELFVPICTGLTFFRIEVPQDETVLDKWSGENLPAAVTVTLSFAQPYKTVGGTLDVAEEDKLVRTIAIDRTRKLAFTIPPFDPNQLPDANRPVDVNQPTDANKPVDVNEPAGGTSQPNIRPRGQS